MPPWPVVGGAPRRTGKSCSTSSVAAPAAPVAGLARPSGAKLAADLSCWRAGAPSDRSRLAVPRARGCRRARAGLPEHSSSRGARRLPRLSTITG